MMSSILRFAVFLVLFDKASSLYKESYNGSTFVLSDPVVERSTSVPVPLRLSFVDAQNWCVGNVAGSTLATIPNKVVQDSLKEFSKRALEDNKALSIGSRSNIRLNGRYHKIREWNWVNGLPNKGITIKEWSDELYQFYARLRASNSTIYATTPNKTGRFICEYPGNSDQCRSSVLLNGRCYKQRIRSFTWHKARNSCSNDRGDLASFEDLNDTNIDVLIQKLSLNETADYWIGLHINEWKWDNTGSVIKYTNWEVQSPSNYSLWCLCFTMPQSDWRECDCDEPYPFICMLNDTQTQNDTQPQNEIPQFVIPLVSCGTIFLAVIVIAAVVVIRKRRNFAVARFVAATSPRYNNPEYGITETDCKDAPVYEEIQEPKASNCISNTTYAQVQMAAMTGEEPPASNIVYAELDIKRKAQGLESR